MDVHTYTIKDAKASLPRLLQEVASGADVFIEKAGKPIAKVTRFEKDKKKIQFGVLKGKVKVAEDFDAPLPDKLLSAFEGH
jgi:antitoxin (DNA-binding transcriptional repressor) of toxin-antitoxin stability system